MAGQGGTNTACAACKYQRRKCAPDCPLSPYFPADQPKRFANVHKLFGVSNTLRILKHVDPSQREDTVKSIAYEADTREKDPVHGCLGVIIMLQNQVSKLKDELAMAREQLYMLQQLQCFESQQAAQSQHPMVASFAGVSSSSAYAPGPVYGSNAVLMHQSQNNYCGLDNNHLSGSMISLDDHYNLRHESFDPLKLQSATYDHRYGITEADSSALHQVLAMGHMKAAHDRAEAELPRIGSYFGTTAHISSDQFDVDSHPPQMNNEAATLEQADQQSNMHTRALSNGLVNLAVTSADNSGIRRANYNLGIDHVGRDHELRRAGVYLTLTNQH
ncbi:unnamed protein product [Sphagnum troendelagicum]